MHHRLPIRRKPRVIYPPQKVIYIDVDGTLIVNGKVNASLVEWVKEKHKQGFQIIVWSSRGQENSQRAVEMANLQDVVSAVLSKPGAIVDDKGWAWIRYTKALSPSVGAPATAGRRTTPIGSLLEQPQS